MIFGLGTTLYNQQDTRCSPDVEFVVRITILLRAIRQMLGSTPVEHILLEDISGKSSQYSLELNLLVIDSPHDTSTPSLDKVGDCESFDHC